MGELKMSKHIELPIFFHDENTKALELAGVDVALEDHDIMTGNFYSIDAVLPRYTDKYAEIHVGGSQFVCALTVDETLSIINAE